VTAPVPPVEFELRLVESAAELAATRCIHCASSVIVIAAHPGTGLIRAVELRHEAGCPDNVD
jgi:hypothetical protein